MTRTKDIKTWLSDYRKYSRFMRDCNKPEYAQSWGMFQHIRNVILHYYGKKEYKNIFNPFWK